MQVKADPGDVWALLRNVKEWWIPSNPEHDSLELLGDAQSIEEGARLRIRESIAGLAGEAEGEVTQLREGELVRWEAPIARYRFFGMSLQVAEGVEWRVEPLTADSVTLSATVWAIFPEGMKGRVLEWLFRGLLKGVDKDRAHTRTELEYLKDQLERDTAA